MKKIGISEIKFYGQANVYEHKGFKIVPFIFNGKIAYHGLKDGNMVTGLTLGETRNKIDSLAK